MKKFLSLITLLLLVVSVNNAYAGKPKQLTSTITWELKEDGTLVIVGTGEMPDFEDGEMSPWFKKAEKITAVRIGEGITTVGKYSFENCSSYVSKKGRCYNISKVTLPSSLKAIGWCAFYNNKITSLIIPDSVTSIGYRAFEDCSSLKSITIPDGVTEIGASVFEGCSSLKSITIPDGVTEIGASAFKGCSSLKSITIPDSVTSIGDAAFCNCRNLESVTIGDGVTKIENFAFYGCWSLTNLTIGARVTTIGGYAFECNNLSSLSIPNSVTSIGWAAFAKSADSDNIKQYFNGTIINLPSWLTYEKSKYIGLAHQSYWAYRPSAEEMYDKGYKYYDIKDYKTALEYFLKGTQSECASGSSSDVARCYLYAGWCYGDLNDYSNAIIMLEKAEELGNNNARSALKSYREKLAMQKEMTKAKTEYDKGNFELAFEHYVKAYYENRTTTTANNLNIVPEYYEKKGDYNNALKFYSRIKSISVDSNVDERIVYCYEKLGNINGAIGVYKSKAEGGNKEYQYKLGGLYEKAKNKNLAIFWYRKAAEQQHLKAEEALAKYGIYIEKHNNQNNGNSNYNNHNHSQEQKQQTYTPEYGVRDVWVNCFDCHGTGKCSYCNGTGWCISTNGHGEYNSSYKCTICHGSGRCTYCYGSGGHYEKQQYQIR